MPTADEALFRSKLTKKFFMELPDGLYMVSNVFHNPMQSIFAEEVVPPQLREDQ